MTFRTKHLFAAVALVLAFTATRLAANPIALGSFGYIYSDSNGAPGFSFTNYTGAADNCGATVSGPNTGCYPVTAELTFTDVVLTVDYSVGGIAQAPLVVSVPNSDSGLFAPSYNGCGTFGVDTNCGDPTYSWEVPGSEVLSGGNLLVTSATLTGSFTPTSFTLTDGSLYTSTGTFSASLAPATDCPGNTDLNGNPTDDCFGDATDLVTDLGGSTTPSTVPEPATYGLLLSGLGIWMAWRKRTVQN